MLSSCTIQPAGWMFEICSSPLTRMSIVDYFFGMTWFVRLCSGVGKGRAELMTLIFGVSFQITNLYDLLLIFPFLIRIFEINPEIKDISSARPPPLLSARDCYPLFRSSFLITVQNSRPKLILVILDTQFGTSKISQSVQDRKFKEVATCSLYTFW